MYNVASERRPVYDGQWVQVRLFCVHAQIMIRHTTVSIVVSVLYPHWPDWECSSQVWVTFEHVCTLVNRAFGLAVVKFTLGYGTVFIS